MPTHYLGLTIVTTNTQNGIQSHWTALNMSKMRQVRNNQRSHKKVPLPRTGNHAHTLPYTYHGIEQHIGQHTGQLCVLEWLRNAKSAKMRTKN